MAVESKVDRVQAVDVDDSIEVGHGCNGGLHGGTEPVWLCVLISLTGWHSSSCGTVSVFGEDWYGSFRWFFFSSVCCGGFLLE